MIRPKTVGNSWTENVLRGAGVAVRRESVRLLKELALEKRKVDQSRRLYEKEQRSLRILMGRDAYPGGSGGRDAALSEFHPPGFCFKKNGDPRTPKTIHESGTRTILPMDVAPGGIKVQGTPATNVICSDSATLGEVLSTRGEALALLSEIRNTSALLQNPKMLLEAWGEGEDEDPKAYLRQYRKTLLRRLFSVLEGCEEVDDLLQVKNPPGFLANDEELEAAPSSRAKTSISTNPNSVGVWGDPTQILFKHAPQSDREIDMTKSAGGLVGALPSYNNSNPGTSTKHVSFSSKKKGTPGQKTLLQGIIKRLVSKIRLMDQMGQDILEYKRKRPYVTSEHLWGPLIKLLERQSLFSSLTDAEKLPREGEEFPEDSLYLPPVQLSSGGISQLLRPKNSPAAVRTRRSIRCDACRVRILSPLKKTLSFSSKTKRKMVKTLVESAPKPGQSWTLSLSRVDLVRLHHELHTEMVSSRMAAIASSSFIFPMPSTP